MLLKTAEGPLLLAGQAVYSHGEWAATPGARVGVDDHPWDAAVYAQSVKRLRAVRPKRVLFGHDRRGWPD